MPLLDYSLLDQITSQAVESVRKRMNYNLHENLDAKAQRLFNALEPGTVLPVHRHKDTDETYIIVRGKLMVKTYDSDFNMLENYTLEAGTENFGAHILKGTWHTIEVLQPGTVIFEVKDGPYKPLESGDILAEKG